MVRAQTGGYPSLLFSHVAYNWTRLTSFLTNDGRLSMTVFRLVAIVPVAWNTPNLTAPRVGVSWP